MRIIGGRHRGLTLVPLGDGDPRGHLRPTSDRVRESLFNLLAHGGYGVPAPPAGCRVLDLFAGTGALGLEALSRGADSVAFVENGAVALRLLQENLRRMRAGSETKVLAQDATRLGRNPATPATLVFLDPPYGRGLGEQAVVRAAENGWIAQGALLVWEESTAPRPLPCLTPLDARRYGETMITLLRYTVPPGKTAP